MSRTKIEAQIKKGANVIRGKVIFLLQEENVPYEYIRWKSGKTHYVLTVMLNNGEFRFARFAEIILTSYSDIEVEVVADFLIKQLVSKLKQVAQRKTSPAGHESK